MATDYSYLYPHLLLLSVQVAYSGWHILGSMTLSAGADAMIFALYREVFGSIVMLFYVRYKGLNIQVRRQDMARFAFLGFLSFNNVVGTILALQYTSADRYAIMQPLIPPIAVTISIAVGWEVYSHRKLLGVLIAVGGAITVVAWQTAGSAAESNVALGTSIIAVQVFSMANLIVFQKALLVYYDPSVVACVCYTVGTAITAVVCLCWYTRFKTVQTLYFDGLLLPWLSLVYAVFVTTAYCANASSWAVKRLPPSMVTIYATFQPLCTVMLSLVILSVAVTLAQGVGGLLIIIGLIITISEKNDNDNILAAQKNNGLSDSDLVNVVFSSEDGEGGELAVDSLSYALLPDRNYASLPDRETR